jgi:hypothetical protein
MSHDHECACGGACGCQDAEFENEVVELTRDEYVVRLENYLRDLKAEIAAVELELQSLRQPVMEEAIP